MALIPWKPFSSLEKFFEDDEWFFPVFTRKDIAKPAMDLYETDKEVVAEVNIPNFDPEKIEVEVENGILKVSGKIDEEQEEKKKGYWCKEIRKGSFERSITLPVAVKEDKVEATYENGLLKIVMPKLETKPKPKIKIKVKSK